jgi:hypothetical protein
MAAETIRDVVIRVGLQQVDAKLTPPDVRPVQEAQRKVSEGQERIADAAEEAERKQTDANLKAADGFKAAAEGAFTFARGVALLGVANEEDLAAIAGTIAEIQGKFDVFKGGVDAVKGFTEGTRALKEAVGAASLAEAAHTIAIGIKTKAATIATGALTAMQAALGPVGIAIAGVAAASAILATAWVAYESRARPPVESFTEAIADQIAETKRLGEAARETGQFISNLGKADEAAFAKRLELLGDEDQRLAAIQQRRERIEQIGVLRTGDQTARSQANTIREQLAQYEQIGAASGINVETEAQARQQLAQAELIDAAALADQDARRLELLRERIALVGQEGQAREKALDQERQAVEARRQQLKTTQELVRAEQNRLASLDEIVGRLTAEQRIQLERLGEKAQAGTITAEEVKQAEQLGGAGVAGFASQFFQRQGRAAGGASVFDAFGGAPARGEGSELARLEQQRNQAAGKFGALGAFGAAAAEVDISRQLLDLAAKRQRSSEQTQKLLGELIDLEQQLSNGQLAQAQRVRELERRLAQAESALQQQRAAT